MLFEQQEHASQYRSWSTIALVYAEHTLTPAPLPPPTHTHTSVTPEGTGAGAQTCEFPCELHAKMHGNV